MVPATFEYWAFISYSQKDAHWADWLQTALENYRVPRRLRRNVAHEPLPKRLFPTYRDVNEQEASADLGAAIRKNLERSRYLIVICSPRSAQSQWVNEEVNFFRAIGRGDRILCLIVDGEPNARPGSETEECFPVALRSRHNQPVASDVRKGKDSTHRALVKLVAGILGVGFNQLWRRELRRWIRRILRNSAAAFALLMFITLLYVSVADHGVAVPAGHIIRSHIDRRDASVFRPAHSMAAIVAAADAAREPIAERLRREWATQEWLYSSPNRTAGPKASISPWVSSQAACAAIRSLGSRPDRLKEFWEMLEEPFRRGFPIVANGRPYGWFVGDANYPQVHPALWTVAALAAVQSNTNLLSPDQKRGLLARLETAQQIAITYHPSPDGGWNIVPHQKRPEEHAVSATALAFLALLELHHSGVGWQGDDRRLASILSSTAKWLTQRFDSKTRLPGWRIQLNETGSGERGEVADGLTLQIYSQFLRAEDEAGIPIPPPILEAIPWHIDQLDGRPISFPNTRSSTSRYFKNIEGHEVMADVPETHLWYPWAIDASARWLRRLELTNAGPEARVRARRALGYLIVDLGDHNFSAAATGENAPTFVASETLYALGTVYSLFANSTGRRRAQGKRNHQSDKARP